MPTTRTYRPTLLTWIYTFSAKERDTETGYSVTSLRSVSSSSLSQAQTSLAWHSLIRRFGSRYYSSDLSIWLSVDPQSDKYPSLSPYVYCANNPIKLVDPNGEEIDWVMDKNGRIYWDENAKNQQTTKQGETYLGKEGQRSIGTDVWNYNSDGTTDEQKPIIVNPKNEYVSSYKSTLEKFSEWENNFTNKSVDVLQGFYAVLVSPINDAVVLTTKQDIFGNPTTKEDKIWAGVGLLTFGAGKTLKTLRLFDKIDHLDKVEKSVETTSNVLDVYSGVNTYKKKKTADKMK